MTPTPNLADTSEETRQAIIRTELGELGAEITDLDKYRAYYSGEQKIGYGTAKFKERFGDAFEGFRDNWAGVVCDAIADRLEVIGLRVGRDSEEREAWKGISRRLYTMLLDQDLDDKQADLHTGVFVEGRSAAILWPDSDTGFTMHWNPAQLVRVRYNDDNPSLPDWAVKRWQTATGDIYVTLYTPTALYKYIDRAGESPTTRSNRQIHTLDQIPDSAGPAGLAIRRVTGEPWPLPNLLDEVPVVEFVNRNARSELSDVIPLQDSINYIIEAMFVASEFMAVPQRAVVTKQGAPSGGWIPGAASVWHFDPMVDANGNMVMPTFHEWNAADPSTYIKIVEMFLQHVALTTKTPMRYFFQSDRGGRGDAPSGESLKVEDKPLLDKIRKRAVSMGNRWYRLVRLADRAVRLSPTLKAELEYPSDKPLPSGEVLWRDQRIEYRSAALADAVQMLAAGLPREFVWKQIGFTDEELEEALDLYEAEQEAAMEKQREQMEMVAEIAPKTAVGTQAAPKIAGKQQGKPSPSTDGINRPPKQRSGPRPSNG